MDNKNPYNNNIESNDKRLGATFLILGWITAIVLVVILVNFSLFGTKDPMISSSQVGTQITISRDHDGHFRLKGSVNDSPVIFLLDTGASSVAVSDELAKRAGLKPKAELITETANGSAVGYFTVIDKMMLGPVELNHVSAVIVPNLDSDQALLGMNILQHFEITQNRDTMVLVVSATLLH